MYGVSTSRPRLRLARSALRIDPHKKNTMTTQKHTMCVITGNSWRCRYRATCMTSARIGRASQRTPYQCTLKIMPQKNIPCVWLQEITRGAGTAPRVWRRRALAAAAPRPQRTPYRYWASPLEQARAPPALQPTQNLHKIITIINKIMIIMITK